MYIYIHTYRERERDVYTRTYCVYTYVCIYIYIYIRIYRERERYCVGNNHVCMVLVMCVVDVIVLSLVDDEYITMYLSSLILCIM